jgi:hypothetical protein
MDLERELRALDVAWPATPPLRLPVRSRRRWAFAAALVAAAVAVAFAVPQSRGAIFRLFHVGGVTVERVDTLPPAPSRPLVVGIGGPATVAQAKGLLGTRLLLPADTPRLYRSGRVVSAVLPGPVLLSEFAYGPGLTKKLAAAGTDVESVVVRGRNGLWISGAPHDFWFPNASPRLAGNVLLWEDGPVTYRLEGGLSRADALALAASLGYPGKG